MKLYRVQDLRIILPQKVFGFTSSEGTGLLVPRTLIAPVMVGGLLIKCPGVKVKSDRN
jgi:hypothetical protein